MKIYIIKRKISTENNKTTCKRSIKNSLLELKKDFVEMKDR